MAQTLRTERNGTIELLRFLFALGIVGIHLEQVSDFGLFHNGHFGVEFFFLLSGLLMAQSANRRLSEKTDVAESTRKFILKKMRTVLPYALITMIASLFLFSIPYFGHDTRSLIEDLINSLPAILMIQMSGAGFSTTMCPGILWYLSAMLLGLLILYPIYLKWNKASRAILFPLIGVFSIGFLQLRMGYITLTWESSGSIYYGFIRGLGEMALGAVCYDLAIHLRKTTFTRAGKTLIVLSELILIVTVAAFINGELINPQSASMLIVIAMLLIIVYSDVTYNLKCGKLISFLGKVSLPLFITHIAVFNIMMQWFGTDIFYGKGPEAMVLCVIVAVACYFLITFLLRYWDKFRKIFIADTSNSN